MTRRAHSPSSSPPADRGSAVIVALMATVLLNALGLGLIALTNTEATIASNFREASEIAYAAEAAASTPCRSDPRGVLDDVLSGRRRPHFAMAR